MSQSQKPHRRRPIDAWARIRADYAAGVPARIAAERGGVSLSTLRTRARKEGWRRSDGCGPPAPDDWSPALEAGLEGDPALLAEEAWLNAARHLQLGRLAEASAWARMAAHCRRAARDAEREDAGPLSVLFRILSELGKPVGRMHTAEGERTLLEVFAQVLTATGELRGPDSPPAVTSARTPARARPSASDPRPEPAAAPECKSQGPVPNVESGELHPLHTAHKSPTSSAHPRESGDPGVFAPPRQPPADRGLSSGPGVPDTRKKAWVPAFAGMSGTEEAPSAPPWAALAARPDADTTPAERCVRRRLGDHRLHALWASDRPKALRLWSRWRAKFDIDPDRPISPPHPSCVSRAPHLSSGPRATLL